MNFTFIIIINIDYNVLGTTKVSYNDDLHRQVILKFRLMVYSVCVLYIHYPNINARAAYLNRLNEVSISYKSRNWCLNL